MRHRVAHRKLGRVTSHRIAMLRNMATSLFDKERIRTTLMRAKELRPFAEKLITLARHEEGRLHNRRLVARDIHDPRVVRKLFDDLGSRFAARPGGYTRILRLGTRAGDGAEMAIVELLGSEFKPGKKEEKAKGKAADKADKGDKKDADAKPAKKDAEAKPAKKPAARKSKKAAEAAAE
jgi:large subunit ribosomal protein L17